MQYTQHSEIVYTPDGELLGVWLGHDHWTEHEIGIAPIQKAFLCNNKGSFGILKRKIQRCPDEFGMGVIYNAVRKKNGRPHNSAASYIFFDANLTKRTGGIKLDWLTNMVKDIPLEEKPIAGAWSDSGFCVIGYDRKSSDAIFEIAKQFKRKNIVIMTSGQIEPLRFHMPGLLIAIASVFPIEVAEQLQNYDADKWELHLESEATGIPGLLEERFSRNARQWVRAGWLKDHPTIPRNGNDIVPDTQYDVLFEFKTPLGGLIQPGWYTVEEVTDFLFLQPSPVKSSTY